ncbi:Rubrerythrin [Gloeomargarita lithophora Alchichica-D10]|uniref:Rubrerythrin n=1 Tax=Gloeomargarita lithophora Alchichica-D10 TaxID=1188229 RepID=A0A1J0AAW9_9CYAN|nr:rubrerythrin family protein [Gloeomargarita lithophora]APB33049.1 Rubrerythrin [Gloeomargarita lithophora Alchichica-D10]
MSLNHYQEDFLGIDRFFQEAVYHDETDLNAASTVEVEMYEHDCMYPAFAAIARESGYPEIGAMFDAIAREEGEHAELVRHLYQDLAVTDTPQTLEAKRLVTEIHAQMEVVANDPRGLRRALETALEVESIESEKTYPAFVTLARQQGKEEVARVFEEIVQSETRHATWVRRALASLPAHV